MPNTWYIFDIWSSSCGVGSACCTELETALWLMTCEPSVRAVPDQACPSLCHGVIPAAEHIILACIVFRDTCTKTPTHRRPCKQGVGCCHLVEHTAQAPDVHSSGVGAGAHEHLRGAVPDRHDLAGKAEPWHRRGTGVADDLARVEASKVLWSQPCPARPSLLLPRAMSKQDSCPLPCSLYCTPGNKSAN